MSRYYGRTAEQRSESAKKAADTRKKNDARCLTCYGSGTTRDCQCGHLASFHDKGYRNQTGLCQWGRPPYYDKNGHEPCDCPTLQPVPCPECEGTGKRLSEWVNPLKVGDILQGSWGYDQTNIDFYQVIEATRRMVTIVELAAFNAKGNGYSNHVYPAKDQFIGEPLKRLVSRSGSVHVEEWGRWLSKWDGSGKYETDAMAGH